ncbi:MAG: hypothetical protein CMF74_12280 [Maricaulis sp.]|nr:hypothetical protein [Maricaulis sp.]
MFEATTIDIAPLIPLWSIGLLTGIAVLAALAGALLRLNGWLWRAATALLIAAVLLNPSLVDEQRDPLPDIAVVVTDRTESMEIGGRSGAADAALEALRTLAERDDSLELVETEISPSADGSLMMDAVNSALAGVPRDRLAGVVAITDGQIHDAPPDANAIDLEAPFHQLMAGDPGAGDRRLTIVESPRYGLVGEPAVFTVRVDDDAMTGTATVTFRIDGGDPVAARVTIGEDTSVETPIGHRGANVVEIEVEPGPEELSLVNNRAAVSVTGVRDRLRVLLVTGEPHNGARAWRDLLKSDPSVDLVHFTILRPPDRQDTTPIDELALIAFPTRELFAESLEEFDLVIFDRYRRRGIMPPLYFDYIARYVENGGALLVTAGPPFAAPVSIYRTPLAAVIPARPTGFVATGPFRPELTETGTRHPVTAGLAPDEGAEPWGRWFRRIDATPLGGETLLQSPDGGPLLVLSHAGEGRAAILLSDQSWLWGRGFDGGGPDAEMFRRVAHWLMQEPELDEEHLSAVVRDGELQVQRRTLAQTAPSLEITWPDGTGETTDMIGGDTPGLFTVERQGQSTGLVRLRSGDLTTVAALGPLNPREYADLAPTREPLTGLVEASGGGAFAIGEADALTLPQWRRTRVDAVMTGRSWLGLQRNERFIVRAAERTPLAPALLALLLILATLGLAWRREGR